MGTYMGIGIVTKMAISKNDVKNMKSSMDELQKDINKEFTIRL